MRKWKVGLLTTALALVASVAWATYVGPLGPPTYPPTQPHSILCNYQTPAPSIASGSMYPVQCDSAGNVQTILAPSAGVAAGITSVVSTTTETSHVIKASAGNLYGFSVTSGATAGYVLVLNLATDPGNGAVTPTKCYVLPASSTLAVSFGSVPSIFITGITIVFSTTGCFTETQSATAFISGDAK